MRLLRELTPTTHQWLQKEIKLRRVTAAQQPHRSWLSLHSYHISRRGSLREQSAAMSSASLSSILSIARGDDLVTQTVMHDWRAIAHWTYSGSQARCIALCLTLMQRKKPGQRLPPAFVLGDYTEGWQQVYLARD